MIYFPRSFRRFFTAQSSKTGVMAGPATARFLVVALFVGGGSMCVGQSRYSITDEGGGNSTHFVVLHDAVSGVEAVIAPDEGGELSSFRIRFNDDRTELLYMAKDYSEHTGTRGKAPLLWPALGTQYPVATAPTANCADGTYEVQGKAYPMPCRGFALTLPWKEVGRSSGADGAKLVLELSDSEATHRYYPYAFRLDETYRLSHGLLTISYEVTAGESNAGTMPFSIGNHLTF